MKAIMYHYVRPGSADMPYFRYLGLDDFRRQLDHFEEAYGFVSQDAFLASFTSAEVPPGVVLTFDDGFRDHYDNVLPELRDRGLWGIFYVPVGMYATGKLLDVHRTHVLLGTFGGQVIIDALEASISEDMLDATHVAEFHTRPYSRQTNDEATTLAKRTLNYFISYDHREAALDRLMEHFVVDEAALVGDYYMTNAQIRELQDAGMIVGSHSCSHPLFSKLDEAAQRWEIEESFRYLDDVTGTLTVRSFCYPYGGFHSFNDVTERILDDVGCRFAFNVEQRDISPSDVLKRPQALPRYDCNQFPHGKARQGDRAV